MTSNRLNDYYSPKRAISEHSLTIIWVSDEREFFTFRLANDNSANDESVDLFIKLYIRRILYHICAYTIILFKNGRSLSR